MYIIMFLVIAPIRFYYGTCALLIIGHSYKPLLHTYVYRSVFNCNILCGNKLHFDSICWSIHGMCMWIDDIIFTHSIHSIMKDIQQGGHACNHQNLYHSFPSCIKLIFIVHNVTGPEKNQYYLHKIHLFILEQLSLFIMCYTKSRCRPVFAWFLKLDSV